MLPAVQIDYDRNDAHTASARSSMCARVARECSIQKLTTIAFFVHVVMCNVHQNGTKHTVLILLSTCWHDDTRRVLPAFGI